MSIPLVAWILLIRSWNRPSYKGNLSGQERSFGDDQQTLGVIREIIVGGGVVQRIISKAVEGYGWMAADDWGRSVSSSLHGYLIIDWVIS